MGGKCLAQSLACNTLHCRPPGGRGGDSGDRDAAVEEIRDEQR